jgi:hypothetical protein
MRARATIRSSMVWRLLGEDATIVWKSGHEEREGGLGKGRSCCCRPRAAAHCNGTFRKPWFPEGLAKHKGN